jgi:hypothetical protein
MLASEYAEQLYCQCLHADSDSAFVVENHLETQEDLNAVCLAEAGAEYAVINQPTTAAGVTAFLEHINSGGLETCQDEDNGYGSDAGTNANTDSVWDDDTDDFWMYSDIPVVRVSSVVHMTSNVVTVYTGFFLSVGMWRM